LGVADNANQFDPFGDIVALVSGPIAGAIRSVEQLRHGAEEFMRGVENFNATMENLNQAAARINRLLDDFEEPARVIMPQITRTVKAADELTQKLSNLPVDPADFMKAMMDLSNRLAPLAQVAESATGMFGLRLPGFGRTGSAPAAPPPSRPEPSPPARTVSSRKTTSSRSSAAKKSTSSRASGAKKSTSSPRGSTRR
jgi:hypothetical protein